MTTHATHHATSVAHPETLGAASELTPLPGKDAALALLQRGVADLITSAGWRRALEFRRRFHNYSFFNTSLILAQHPTAQLVAGYRAWQKAGRQVRRGERGLTILAPLLRKDPTDPNVQILVGFRAVKVFDVQQTDGDPIPTTPTPVLLSDTDSDRAQVLDLDARLVAYATREGLRVHRNFDHPHALGVYRPSRHEIALRPGLSAVQTFKTLVHELAHHLLHTTEDDRHIAELEAETTAFLVCDALGIDTRSYSFAYLAHWQRSLDELLHAGERGSRAARTLLTALGRAPEQPLARIDRNT